MYSSLRITTPPTEEPISLFDAKKHLRVDNDYDDTLIGALITSARTMVEMTINRCLLTQTLLWTMSQDPPSGALPLLPLPLLILPVILTAPQVMNKPLELPRSPVQSITSITETDIMGNVTTLDTTQYIPDLAVDPARVRLNWLVVPRWLQHIQVTFVAGYGSTPASVPLPIVLAIKMWIAFLYEHRGDNPESAGEPPKAIEYLLAPYKVAFFP
jgi:hypothetical protein